MECMFLCGVFFAVRSYPHDKPIYPDTPNTGTKLGRRGMRGEVRLGDENLPERSCKTPSAGGSQHAGDVVIPGAYACLYCRPMGGLEGSF